MRRVLESHWVRHPRVWYLIGGLFWVVIVVTLILSRNPPTQFFPQAFIPSGHPGDVVQITVPVRRNLSRSCSVDSTHTFFDANHAAEIAAPTTHISAQGMALRERADPNRVTFNAAIPKNATYGPASVIVELQYSCPLNPSTWFRKIDDAFVVYLNVTPKAEP